MFMLQICFTAALSAVCQLKTITLCLVWYGKCNRSFNAAKLNFAWNRNQPMEEREQILTTRQTLTHCCCFKVSAAALNLLDRILTWNTKCDACFLALDLRGHILTSRWTDIRKLLCCKTWYFLQFWQRHLVTVLGGNQIRYDSRTLYFFFTI